MDSLSLRIQQKVAEGVSTLKSGGVVAFPTDTVYSLGCDIYNREAVARLYQLKGRPRRKALPLLLAGVEQIDEVALSVPEVARRLAVEFMPGALTLVLKKRASVPDIITAGGDTIALRVPAHPIPLALVRGLGMPITGTSANLSGRPSALTAGEVRSQFGSRVDLVIDGGRVTGGTESTIVDVSGDIPVILREGAISRAELALVCRQLA
ncbi:MAG: L-threonylcarbamoyladenylate synthase [Dehalococcoidales bacterium]|jgi:L-threonylcarbamoyladenylate synthase